MFIQDGIYRSVKLKPSVTLPIAEGTVLTVAGTLANADGSDAFGLVPETIKTLSPAGMIRVAVAGTIDLHDPKNAGVNITKTLQLALTGINFVPEPQPDKELPKVSAADDGKILVVVDGAWSAGGTDTIDAAVSDWLDDHPEATTTVEDGTISLDKLASDIHDDIKDMNYYAADVQWVGTASYPTGWSSGYFTGSVGDTCSTASSSRYIRMRAYITEENYPSLVNCKKMKFTPPADYGIKVFECDSAGKIISITGEANTEDTPSAAGKPVEVEVTSGRSYRCNVGKWSTGSSSYAENEEFISSIKVEFFYDKPQKKSRSGDFEFFDVTVPRPLSFGGEETNTGTDTVEAVLRLPLNYTPGGDPVPLVLMCHGASGYIQKSTGTWYSSDWKALCDDLLDAGYALFDVNVLPTSAGTDIMGLCMGSPLAVNVAKAAYDYIENNYNVQKQIFAHGTSMGGVLASAFVQAFPQLVLAQSSFAGRDLIRYLDAIKNSSLDDDDDFAVVYGYTDFDALTADKFSHAESLVPSLSLKKYTSGAVTLPPDRDTAYLDWIDYYIEIQSHEKTDAIGDYTAYRSVPYKSWNSWADNEGMTKAEQILQKAFTNGGSAPYLCVFYDEGTHNEISHGKINNMRDQLIAWFNRWV